jgi:Brp/Blh family beta-carotene 15,15'-monooxygenase
MLRKNERLSQFYLLFLCLSGITYILSLVLSLSIPPNVLILSFAIMVLILGVPHGALDYFIAKQAFDTKHIFWLILFFISYIVVASLSTYLWYLFPSVCLVLFLLISIFHFASDWRNSLRFSTSIALAALVICGPAFFYAISILHIFEGLMIDTESAKNIVQIMFIIAVLASVILLVNFLQGYFTTVRFWIRYELLGLALSSILIPPLVHFVLYFCFLHALQHMCDFANYQQVSLKKVFVISAPVVLLSVALSLLIPYFFPNTNFESNIYRIIFISLFGLTMSHMLVISYWHKWISYSPS